MSIRAHTLKLSVTHEVTVLSSSAPVPKALFAFARRLVASGDSDAAIAVPHGSSGQAILKRVGETNEVRGLMLSEASDRESGVALCEDLAFWARAPFTLGQPIEASLERSMAGRPEWSVGLSASPLASLRRSGAPASPPHHAAQNRPSPVSTLGPMAPVIRIEPATVARLEDRVTSQPLLPNRMVRACAFVALGAVGFLAAVLAARAALGAGGAT